MKSSTKPTISIKQPLEQTNQETDIQFCFFCNKKAQFRCGVCLQAMYCTPEHQKADWPSHKRRCIRPEDKLKELYKHLQSYKKLFFDKLSKRLMNQCEGICDNILKINEEILLKFPSPQHEIEYGTAICCYVKMLLAVKSFNEAQQILNNYLKQRDDFLRNLDNIPSKIAPQDPNYGKTIQFVQGKLKLLSVLCNLTHQTVRNSVYMIEILLKHCEKFYGDESLEVSNVYFELGNYYYFMNQSMKACACYLLAGKIRKQKGISSFFNAAIILMKNQNYTQSITFLQKCLAMVQGNGDPDKIIDRLYLGLAFCFKKLNHFDNTVHYLEKALCQVTNKNRFENSEKKLIENLLIMLSEQYKKEFNNDQILSLPREKSTNEPQIIISSSNLDDLWDIDVDNTKRKKTEQWMKSFKNETDKTKFQSKIPMTNPLLQKVLFVNHFTDDKNEQASGPALANKSSSNTPDYINVDLQFMSKLTATEVRFMNELNRLLVINKDKPNLHDVIENSNLMQELSKEKIERFYQLNPELMRQKQDYNLIDEEDQDVVSLSQGTSNNVNANVNKNQPVSSDRSKLTPRPKFQKLDLSKVPRNT